MTVKIYRYGATHQVSRRDPDRHKDRQITNIDLVNEAIFKSHRYLNQLVEIERERREQKEARQLEINRPYQEVCDAIAALEQRITDLYAEQAQWRIEHRARTTPPELRDRIRSAKAERGPLNEAKRAAKLAPYIEREPEYERLKERRSALLSGLRPAERKRLHKEDPELIEIDRRLAAANAMYDDIEQAASEKVIAARAESGLYWGTYMLVEDAMEQIRKTSKGAPKFRRYDGTGATGVKFQNSQANTPVEDLFEGGTTIAAIEGGPNTPGKRWLKLRIGSEDKAGRKPIWAVIPFRLYRPLPSEGKLKRINLIRRRVGPDHRYEVQFTVEFEGRPELAQHGEVGIDVGYRKLDEGLRVACWAASDGRQGEITLPQDLLAGWAKARDLQSIRALHFNEIKLKLQAYVSSHKIPEWMSEAAKTLAQWRSPARLCKLMHQWRENRYEGDEQTYGAMQAWRLHDKHLYLWERYAERRAANRRKDIYRCAAKQLAKEYGALNAEKLNLRAMQQAPPSEEEQRDPALLYYRKNACLHELVGAIKESGITVMEWPPYNTTRRCHECGHINEWADQSERILRCGSCGATWDQDHNAALNLLRAAEWMPDGGGRSQANEGNELGEGEDAAA